MYVRYVRKVWRLLVVVFIVWPESKRLPISMVVIAGFIVFMRIRAPLVTCLMRVCCEI